MFDKPLILRRAASFASEPATSAPFSAMLAPFLVADGVLVEHAEREVAVDFGDSDAVVLKVEQVSHKQDCFLPS
jgi:hypothetical protein